MRRYKFIIFVLYFGILANSCFSQEEIKDPMIDLDKIVKFEPQKTNVIYLYYKWCKPCELEFKKLDSIFKNDFSNKFNVKIHGICYVGLNLFTIKKDKGEQKHSREIEDSKRVLIYSDDNCLNTKIHSLRKNLKPFKYKSDFILVEDSITHELIDFCLNFNKLKDSTYQICYNKYALDIYTSIGGSSGKPEIKNTPNGKMNNNLNFTYFSDCIGVQFAYKLGLKKKPSYFSIGGGIRYEWEKITYSADTLFQTQQSIDIDNEAYEKRIKTVNYSEKNNLNYLSVFFTIQYTIYLTKYLSMEFSLSPVGRMNVFNQSEKNGIFSQTGFYSKYNLLENVDRLGFAKNVAVTDNRKLDMPKFSWLAIFQAKFLIDIRKNIKAVVGASYSYSQITVKENDILISKDFLSISSPIYQSSSFTLSYFSGIIGLRLYF